jgi:hypothetical protein
VGGRREGGKEGRKEPDNRLWDGVDLSSGGAGSIPTCHPSEIASTPLVDRIVNPTTGRSMMVA